MYVCMYVVCVCNGIAVNCLNTNACMHVCMYVQSTCGRGGSIILARLGGEDEKDQKRKDSLVVLAARMNNEAPVSR